MAKTPIRTLLLPRLTALNDQLCFFQLIDHEFVERLSTFGPGVAAVYTPDVFARNPFADRIHVTVAKLPHFREQHRTLTLGAHFAMSYEVAAQFFPSAKALLAEINGKLAEPLKMPEGPEQYYVRLLHANGLSGPPSLLAETMAYCRYRRNSFIHLGAAVPAMFTTLAAQYGSALNARWSKERGAIDFSSPTIASLSDKEALTLLQLLRICVQDLDEHLATVLRGPGVAAYVARRLKPLQAPGPKVIAKRVAAIRRRGIHLFDFDPGEIDARAAI